MSEIAEAVLQHWNRSAHRTAELAIEFPDAPLIQCVYWARVQDLILYGNPWSPPPVGFISGRSPIQSLQDKAGGAK